MMKNRFLRLLKHDLNHVTDDQAMNTFRVVLASIACHNKGTILNDCLRAAKLLDYNEPLMVGKLAEEFGADEFARIKKTWDSLSPSENDEDDDKKDEDDRNPANYSVKYDVPLAIEKNSVECRDANSQRLQAVMKLFHLRIPEAFTLMSNRHVGYFATSKWFYAISTKTGVLLAKAASFEELAAGLEIKINHTEKTIRYEPTDEAVQPVSCDEIDEVDSYIYETIKRHLEKK